jgi:glycerophosphoryl diester phosphodiesterase
VAATGFAGIMTGCQHISPTQLHNSNPSQNDTRELWVIVHRVNTPASADDIRRLAVANPGLTFHGRPVRWGAEIDLQYKDSKLIASHSRLGTGALTLVDVAGLLHDESILVIDLKSSVLADEAITAVRKSVSELPQPIVYSSFDHRILAKLRDDSNARVAFMTWQMSRSGGWLRRFTENVARLFGVWGGFLPGQLDVSIVAVPWYQATADLVGTLRNNGVETLCGTVDSDRALSAIAHLPVFGLFTDHPELIADYMRQHP